MSIFIAFMRVSFVLFVAMLACRVSGATEDTVTVTDLAAKPQRSFTYSEREADKILKAMEGLAWDGTTGARCHIPQYRVQARSQAQVILDASVCFTCHNVRFSAPKEKGLKGFFPDDASAKLLNTILTKISDSK